MKVDLINGDEVLIKISGATIIISKVSAILLRDHLSKLVEEKFTAGRTLAGIAPPTRPAVKLPSTEDVWNYVYNHHEFCEDFARENEARDISKLVYEFIYRQLQA